MFALGVVLADAAVPSQPADLPSPPGPHIAQIDALGDNSWFDLGPPAPDPDWGRAHGRNWTSKMAYAADLGGAFLFGEGAHGWHNPKTGRYMDDLWFYDAMAHRWMNLYPGFNVRDPPTIALDDDGFTNIDGKPVPIASMVHGYDMTTWDSDTERFMSMPCPGNYWRKAIPSLHEVLHGDASQVNLTEASPWFFDVRTGEWGRSRTVGRSPKSGVGDTLIYVPMLKKTFFRRKADVWFYDAMENRWVEAQPLGKPPPFGIDANSCLDRKRGRIYLGGGKFPVASGPNALWIYDLETGAWVDPKPQGAPGHNSFGTAAALLHCDVANDVVVLFRHRGKSRGVYVYNPNSNEWVTMTDGLPESWLGLKGNERGAVSGFYDAELNVHLFFVAGESRGNGRVFAYRYRNKVMHEAPVVNH